ncbi:MAG TPA: DUF2961 domain-containing protein, partial [Chloroflexia bacterium]|nr:DUF2961 domain-containing protein [Chloroflexia bacterium]
MRRLLCLALLGLAGVLLSTRGPVTLPGQAPGAPPRGPAALLPAPPLYLGLDAYRHWDKLAYLEIGDRVAGQSTADPGGTNWDNSQVLRILPDGQHVLFDQLGPGVVTFLRMQETYGAPWNLDLDGGGAIPVAPAMLGQPSPAGFPASAFPYPLSLAVSQTQGSSILAAAIPFAHRLTWTSVLTNGNFYALYRKLPYGTPLTTWTGTEPVADVAGLLQQAGTDLAPAGLPSLTGTLTITAGETTLTTLPGPSQIRALQISVPAGDQVGLGNARLRIYWDGETSPSVDTPLKFLAGDGAGVYQPADRPLVRGWIAGAGGDGQQMAFNLYWPMPFTTTARIAIAPTSAITIPNVTWAIRAEPFYDPPGWWGTFHATYTSVPTPTLGEDMTFLDVAGSGRVVGTVVNFAAPGSTLEGDPRIFIDDNQTPQIAVTGSEEWGLGGNYWNGGIQTSLPLGGLPSSLNNPPGADVDGAALYRFLIADSIPFNRHVVIRWEHGGRDETPNPYRAAVFWYGTPVQTALLSDELRLDDAASRAAHQYQAPGATPYDLQAGYEYPPHTLPISGTVIALTTVSSFTLAVDPRNAGTFLRRTFDYGRANQRARLFVDGQFAGTWYSAGASTRVDGAGVARRWRDEEFPLPAALTAGKSAVTIRVEAVLAADPPAAVWTEARYQLYSFVLPPADGPSPPCAIIFQDVPPAAYYYGPVESLACRGVLSGYDDGTFRPAATTTRGQLAKIVAGGFALPAPTPAATFADVPITAPLWSSIETAAQHDIAGGYACGGLGEPCDSQARPYFRPAAPVTRGQLAKILIAATGWSLVDPPTARFADVPPSSAFYPFV